VRLADVPCDQEGVRLRLCQGGDEGLDVGRVEEVQVQVGEPGQALHAGIVPAPRRQLSRVASPVTFPARPRPATMCPEEAMIALTQEQRRQLEQPGPARVRDPETGEAYVLVREDVYERLRALLEATRNDPVNGAQSPPQQQGGDWTLRLAAWMADVAAR